MISSTIVTAAKRYGGICEGTLSFRFINTGNKQKGNKKNSNSNIIDVTNSTTTVSSYSVLIGCCLHIYEQQIHYIRHESPIYCLYVVGASSATTTTNNCEIQIVTNQGTQLYLYTSSETCRDIWLEAFQTGLEMTLSSTDDDDSSSSTSSSLIIMKPQDPPKLPDLKVRSTGFFRTSTPIVYCRSCTKEIVSPTTSTTTTTDNNNAAKTDNNDTNNTGSTGGTVISECYYIPLLVYGLECKHNITVCYNCYNIEMLILYMINYNIILQSNIYEIYNCNIVRNTCIELIQQLKTQQQQQKQKKSSSSSSSTDISDNINTNNNHNTNGTSSGNNNNNIVDSNSYDNDNNANDNSNKIIITDNIEENNNDVNNDNNNDTTTWVNVESEDEDEDEDSLWVNVESEAATKIVTDYLLHSSEYTNQLSKSCPALQCTVQEFLNGSIGLQEFMEQLDNLSGIQTNNVMTNLKKQAFQKAGDMGTAMKLLQEQAIPTNNNSNANIELLQCVLEFFLDLIETDISSIAFFWPQILHLHLRMLPPKNAYEIARVELMEDFLITVSCKYSIHLALDLIWSHTADLEESLQITNNYNPKLNDITKKTTNTENNNNNNDNNNTTKSKNTSTTTTVTKIIDTETPNTIISTSCRKRRYAVLRFLCELESLLFDFDNGWGGGSVALGNMLLPTTTNQINRLKEQAIIIQNFRKKYCNNNNNNNSSNINNYHYYYLSRSVRNDKLTGKKNNKNNLNNNQLSTEEIANERYRIAKNADYYTCHINFSRRLSDIAEKLRFITNIVERPNVLEYELNLLNSSGTMGGDPLNRVRDHLLQVVRIPSTEGHVFRSKERTPVLLLMEVIDEKIAAAAATAAAAAAASEQESNDDSNDDDDDEVLNHNNNNDDDDNHSIASAHSVTLEGARESPAPYCLTPKALKRFDSDGELIERHDPSTPKTDVEQIVNSVAQEQLMGIVMPDIGKSSSDKKKEEGKVVESTIKSDTLTGEIGMITTTILNDGKSQEHEKSDRVSPSKVSEKSTSKNVSSPNESKHTTTLDDSGKKKARSSSIKSTAVSTEEEAKRKVSTLGSITSASGKEGCDQTKNLAPTGDIRRAVLTTIMMRGLQGNTIAAGTTDSVQRSLQDLERKRATELLLREDSDEPGHTVDSSLDAESESTRQKLVALGLSPSLEEAELASRPTEEDEVLEAIRLILIQNRVAQGHLSPADAAKVLQHASLSPINSSTKEAKSLNDLDARDFPVIDAGDVDARLVGCGPLPPAVLQAMTLWKGGVVTHAELLELVKKDSEFVKHSILVDAESVNKLKENSAFWGRFAFGERWAEKKSRIGSSSPQGSLPGWDMMGVIVKSNDDLRQEAFVMQLIELCQEAFELAGLELWVSPYRILATGRTTGVIECVRNAMSFDALKKRPGYGKGGLREHLQRMTEFTADPGGAFKSAQRNFVRSLAAYSLMSYFFLFKDRHNGNLLLDTAGHVIHIDFGFVFGVAPGGSFSLEMSTPFKLTEEMLDVMGGLRSPLFSEFVTLFCCGFLALQSHCDTFLTLVEITSKESTFKCFEGRDSEEIVSKFRERFCPDLNKEDTISFALDLIKQATTSYGTRQYDLFQYLSQGIVA